MIALLLSGLALAGGLDAHGFQVFGRSSDPGAYVRLVTPDMAPPGFDVAVLVDHGNQPLMEVLPDGKVPLITALTTANFALGWSPVAWLRFDATWAGHALGATPVGSFAGAGDARVGATWSLVRPVERRVGVALSPSVWLPTGASRYNVGVSSVGGGAILAVGQSLGSFGWTVNGGARLSPAEQVRNLAVGSGPLLGAGVRLEAREDFGLGLELTAQGVTGWRSVPVEAMLTTHSRYQPGTWLVAGLAVGLNDAVGATSWRVVVGAAMGRDEDDGVADEVPVWLPPPCPGSPGCPAVDPAEDPTCEPEEQPPEPLAYLDQERNRIVVVENVFFEEGAARLLGSAEPFLEGVYQVLVEHPEVDHLLIEGHTNNHGSDAYNLELGQARAEQVEAWLVARGIDETRLIPKGYGFRRPLVPHDDPEAARINRRVEFTVLRSDEDPEEIRLPGEEELPPK
ncbi:MAG: OmpA family protein [Deltaproteobacteria bacterium]|nr:OmpA family protein [Deltaproteobacteria bacterium]